MLYEMSLSVEVLAQQLMNKFPSCFTIVQFPVKFKFFKSHKFVKFRVLFGLRKVSLCLTKCMAGVIAFPQESWAALLI